MHDSKIYIPGLGGIPRSDLWAAYDKLGQILSALSAEAQSEPLLYIYAAPDSPPVLMDTKNFPPFAEPERVSYIQDADTELLVGYCPEDSILLKNHLCIVGPVALYHRGEHGERESVSSLDINIALAHYQAHCGVLQYKAVRFRRCAFGPREVLTDDALFHIPGAIHGPSPNDAGMAR